AHAVIAGLALATIQATLRAALDTEGRAVPAALDGPVGLRALMVAACARLGTTRPGAADRRVGAGPTVRIAAGGAVAAGVVLDIMVRADLDPELTFELGDHPLLLGIR